MCYERAITRSGALEEALESYVVDWEKEYGVSAQSSLVGERFIRVLGEVHRQTGRRAMFFVCLKVFCVNVNFQYEIKRM